MKKLTKNQKTGIMAAAVLLVAAVAVVIALLSGRTEGKFRSIKIVETSGEVTISRAGIGDLSASVNMNLVSGDSVHTEQDAYVVLMLDADKYVMLGASGTMEVIAEGDDTSGRTSIRLEQGSVLSEIQNPLGQDSSYEVVTPNATMSVRGTVFEIDREADGLVTLLVYDGAVALAMDGHEPVLCNAGEYMQFEEGNPPRVIVDRESVSEAVINEQMRQRLEKINESGRGLNLGSVKIADNEPVDELPAQESEAAPEPIVEPEPAVTPEPAPTAESENTPEPAATSKPERTPKPAPEQPKPTEAPAPVPEQPKPTAAPTPVPEQPKPTSAPT
ncbi:MAG: FecR domain-containing protein, partial [Acetatifactor sp.]|nr:FecR domain-containing protein [Acetatifactor sp.]